MKPTASKPSADRDPDTAANGAARAEGLARFDAEAAERLLGRSAARRGAALAGIDEAGRGPLAGPVVAAAVVLPPAAILPGVNDSKQLAAERREALFPEILAAALAVGVGVVDAETIDAVNILEATRRAAARALRQADERLGRPADGLLLDALRLGDETRPQEAIVKGDARSQSIAAASIVAKVTRDRLMLRYDAEFPGYGFARHKGYGSPAHLEALERLGPSTLHRLSFGGVSFFDCPLRHSTTFDAMLARLRRLPPGHTPERRSLRAEIEALAEFLPHREIRELLTRLPGAAGLP